MSSVNRSCLYFINVLIFIGGLGIAAAAFFLFNQIEQVLMLLDVNYTLTPNYNFWVPATPYIFFVVTILVCLLSIFGFASARKSNKEFLIVYTIILTVVTLILIASAIFVYIYTDQETTDFFMEKSIRNAYDKSKINKDTEQAFNQIELNLHCCGADNARDYEQWKKTLPSSCCDGKSCSLNDRLANAKFGCSMVASHNTRFFVMTLVFTTLSMAVVCVFGAIVAVNRIRRIGIEKLCQVTVQKAV